MKNSCIWAPVLDPLNQISQSDPCAHSKLEVTTIGLHFPDEGSSRNREFLTCTEVKPEEHFSLFWQKEEDVKPKCGVATPCSHSCPSVIPFSEASQGSKSGWEPELSEVISRQCNVT